LAELQQTVVSRIDRAESKFDNGSFFFKNIFAPARQFGSTVGLLQFARGTAPVPGSRSRNVRITRA
jgi:hypothetical protein